LASRDVVSRAIVTEIREGRGIDGKDYVFLDARHIGEANLLKKLPDIVEISRVYLGIDPVTAPIPIQPTAHYAMGGIPTDIDGRVMMDNQGTPLYGLYAAGEVACVSVHGGNRLGTNSLVDLVVFGRRGGKHMSRFVKEGDHQELPADPEARAREQIAKIFANDPTKESVAKLRNDMQTTMQSKVGIFREEKVMQEAVQELAVLRERFKAVGVEDKGKRFNTDLMEAIELGNLLDIAEITAVAAVNRTESRGAHAHGDYPDRNDEEWRKHTFITRHDDGSYSINYKPTVSLNKPEYAPKKRTY